jgi:hypothetical protein
MYIQWCIFVLLCFVFVKAFVQVILVSLLANSRELNFLLVILFRVIILLTDDNGDEGSNAMVRDAVKIEPDDEDDDDNGIVFTVPVAVSKDDG